MTRVQMVRKVEARWEKLRLGFSEQSPMRHMSKKHVQTLSNACLRALLKNGRSCRPHTGIG